MTAWLERYRSALRERDVRLLLGGLTLSMTGTWAYNVALAVFVYGRTHSLAWVGAAQIVRLVPALVLSPYAGVIAERTERIRLMTASDLGCAMWQAVAVVVIATGGPVALVLVLVALTATTNVVYEPAAAATLPAMVSEDDLVAANALRNTIDNVIVIAGPGIGALLLLLGPPEVTFALNAVSFLASAAIVSRIRLRSRPIDVTEGGAAGVLRQMAVGFRAILSDRAARTLVGFCALVSLLYGTDTVLFVAVSAHRLGTGSTGFGYLLAGMGVGGILMGLAIDRMSRSTRLAPIILGGTAGYCLPTALFTIVHSPELAFVIQVFRGAATLIVDVLAITALQRAVDEDKLARVFGVFTAVFVGAISLGSLLTPAVISGAGLNAALIIMALAPLAVGALGLPALRAIDRETRTHAEALRARADILEELDIFAAASRQVLERLLGAATEVTFAPGTTIVREGDPADALYVLIEGEVQVTASGETGSAERRIRTMRAPTYFGEIGVLGRIPRTATVTARVDCRCERIEGAALLETMTSSPPSTSLMENAHRRLALTHPSQKLATTEAG